MYRPPRQSGAVGLIVATSKALCAKIPLDNAMAATSLLYTSDLLPIRGEDVELVIALALIARNKHYFFAVRRNLGKSREPAVARHLLQTRAVRVDQVQLEIVRIAVLLVGREQNLLAIRRERGGETGAAVIRNLFRVRSVTIGHEQLHLHGSRQIVLQQLFIFRNLLRSIGTIRPPNDF